MLVRILRSLHAKSSTTRLGLYWLIFAACGNETQRVTTAGHFVSTKTYPGVRQLWVLFYVPKLIP